MGLDGESRIISPIPAPHLLEMPWTFVPYGLLLLLKNGSTFLFQLPEQPNRVMLRARYLGCAKIEGTGCLIRKAQKSTSVVQVQANESVLAYPAVVSQR